MPSIKKINNKIIEKSQKGFINKLKYSAIKYPGIISLVLMKLITIKMF